MCGFCQTGLNLFALLPCTLLLIGVGNLLFRQMASADPKFCHVCNQVDCKCENREDLNESIFGWKCALCFSWAINGGDLEMQFIEDERILVDRPRKYLGEAGLWQPWLFCHMCRSCFHAACLVEQKGYSFENVFAFAEAFVCRECIELKKALPSM